MKKKNAALLLLNRYPGNAIPANEIAKVLEEYKLELLNQGDLKSLQRVESSFPADRVITAKKFNEFLWYSAMAQDGMRVLK